LHSSFLPNIHVIERGWLSANQIYLRNENAVDIIDSGFCYHAQQTIDLLQAYVNEFKLQPRNLFNTHLHSDHCGGNQALQNHFQVKCFVPESEFDVITNWPLAEQDFNYLGQPCPQFRADGVIQVGQTLQIGLETFEVHGTPGHHPHSNLLYSPSLKLLISADALWEKGFGALFSAINDHSGFREQRETLNTIASLDVDWVIPGHGKPFKNFKEALGNAYSRLDFLESNPKKNFHHVAQVLFQFMVMFKVHLSKQEGINWCLETPIFVECAQHLQMPVDDLFLQTLISLKNKNCLSFDENQITYQY
jgi:glyoxylase-like metal-dependent hydrolase (beta-lactamase superfamily II)